jgi:hypothetical protein
VPSRLFGFDIFVGYIAHVRHYIGRILVCFLLFIVFIVFADNFVCATAVVAPKTFEMSLFYLFVGIGNDVMIDIFCRGILVSENCFFFFFVVTLILVMDPKRKDKHENDSG